MRTLAILVLVFWVIASFVYADWKRHVAYPSRTFPVGFTMTLYECSLAALAIWVIVRG